jgi:hypothetical protein
MLTRAPPPPAGEMYPCDPVAALAISIIYDLLFVLRSYLPLGIYAEVLTQRNVYSLYKPSPAFCIRISDIDTGLYHNLSKHTR